MSTDLPSPAPAATPAEVSAEALNLVFERLLEGGAAEALAVAQQLPPSRQLDAALTAAKELNPSHFDTWWSYPLQTLTRGVLARAGISSRSKTAEILEGAAFYRAHLRWVFETLEGGACCADKAGWALRALARHYHEGAPIRVTGAENAFWEPKKALNSEEALVEFFEALYALRYGRPEKYLKAMHRLLADSKG